MVVRNRKWTAHMREQAVHFEAMWSRASKRCKINSINFDNKQTDKKPQFYRHFTAVELAPPECPQPTL